VMGESIHPAIMDGQLLVDVHNPPSNQRIRLLR
jgi:hypothetical protein